jgi:membrane protein involved in colicin uptake
LQLEISCRSEAANRAAAREAGRQAAAAKKAADEKAAANRDAARGGGGGGGKSAPSSGTGRGATSATSSGLGGLGFSDKRLKENIELIGKSPSNINIYKFNYKNNPTTYQGVMADEVSWASFKHPSGYMMVDYNKIDVEFKKI